MKINLLILIKGILKHQTHNLENLLILQILVQTSKDYNQLMSIILFPNRTDLK